MKNTKIILAGDMFPMPCNYALFAAGDTQALFGQKLCDLFASADFRICNLEGCFTDNDTPIEKIGPNIKAPTETVRGVKQLGIDVATLGNTHSMDYGRQGFYDTCQTLADSGIDWLGWGENASSVKKHLTLTDGDRKILLYNVTEQFENAPGADAPGVHLYDEYRVCRELNELKEQCDFLIVLYHGGIEGSHYNSEIMRRRFHRMADNGADLIISQHTHAIGEEERYNNAYLLYGHGNFCFHFRPDVTPLLAEGLVLELDITEDGYTVTPHRILRTEQGCVYDDAQDLTEFYARSRQHDALLNGDQEALAEFESNYGKDCAKWATGLFSLLRGINPADDEKRKSLSPEAFKDYLIHSYSRSQLLGIQLFMRNEEFNEMANQILNDLLKEQDQNKE